MKLSELISKGIMQTQMQVQEDFLPMSVAGIFRSNLRDFEPSDGTELPNHTACNGRQSLQHALGCRVHDADEYYREAHVASLEECVIAWSR